MFQWPGLTAEGGAQDLDGENAVPYLQGYGVGGFSNINGMGADRGQPGDYDEWQQCGAEGWDWKGVLPYFKKLEKEARRSRLIDARRCWPDASATTPSLAMGAIRGGDW